MLIHCYLILIVLEQIFQDTKDVIVGQKTPTDEGNKVKNEWRRLPETMKSRECMIIASGGECQGPSVVPKQRDNTQTGSDLQLLRRELDVTQEKIRQDNDCYLVQVCADYPGVEMSRDYYLEKIKQLMTGCKQPGGEHTIIGCSLVFTGVPPVSHYIFRYPLVHWSWRERDW